MEQNEHANIQIGQCNGGSICHQVGKKSRVVENVKVTHLIHQPHISVAVRGNMVVEIAITSARQLISYIDVPVGMNMVVGNSQVNLVLHEFMNLLECEN